LDKIIHNDFKRRKDLNNTAKYIVSLNPQIVGFSSTCADFHVFLYIAKIIKKLNSNIKIIFGGPQPSAVAYEALSAFNWIDAIAIGESEENILPMINCLLNEGNYEDVSGVIFKGQSNQTKVHQCLSDIDSMEFMNYDIFCNKDIMIDPNLIHHIETGRGCPFHCSYCLSGRLLNKKYRLF